jgi:hypothetical protein
MSYNGSKDAFLYSAGRKLEEELEPTSMALAELAYNALQDIRNAEDEIRKLCDQMQRRLQWTIDSMDIHFNIHEPYIERLGVDLKEAIAKRDKAYSVLVTIVGQERVTEMQAEAQAEWDAEHQA